jgi:ParB-like chromosome segregation protein Spo0J
MSGGYGTKKYAFEELIAEISAAFCCASRGIVPTVRHADYIAGWADVLREDSRAIIRAASQASKAVPLHPLDQFRAFQTLREKGMSEEDIAAAFFVGVNIVKQRLRLAAVSSKLLDIYAEDGMSLEQLMAFTVTTDHARQEQVWEALQQSWGKEAYQVRRMLTERTVRASEKRVLFVGLEAYERAGGAVMHDLFEDDDGGWLEDVALLDRLVVQKLKDEATTIAAEGWKWIEVNLDFPYGHTYRLRKLAGTPADITAEEHATIEALRAAAPRCRGRVGCREARADAPARSPGLQLVPRGRLFHLVVAAREAVFGGFGLSFHHYGYGLVVRFRIWNATINLVCAAVGGDDVGYLMSGGLEAEGHRG